MSVIAHVTVLASAIVHKVLAQLSLLLALLLLELLEASESPGVAVLSGDVVVAVVVAMLKQGCLGFFFE